MKRLLIFLTLAAIAALTSCSSFQREWDETIATHNPEAALAGPWEGRWLSHSNAHTGKLRCIISPSQSSTHDFRYWATWGKLSGSYDGAYEINETAPGIFKVEGSADLGVLAGGVYSHTGEIKGDVFNATYTSEKDRGVLEMRRPKIR